MRRSFARPGRIIPTSSRRRRAMKKRVFLVLLVFGTAAGLGAQRIDYDGIYRYPVSLGFEYQSLSPFIDYGFVPTAYYDLSFGVRVPLASLPPLQPFAKLGIITLVPPMSDAQWSHRHFYLMPGVAW